MKPEESETRNALLDHYSSRASDHATQLLTVALIGLTLIEVRLPSYALVVVLPAVIVAAVWVTGRMAYWSYLSDSILHVPDSLGKEVTKTVMETLKPEDEKYFEPTLESWRLHLGAVVAVDHFYHKGVSWLSVTWFRVTWFSSVTPRRLVTLCVVYVVVLVALALVLWVNHGF